MDFEWDDAKAASNLRKHGIAFEGASHVFLDGGRVDMIDDREDHGEIRWLTIGWAGPALLVVAHTWRGIDGDIIRITRPARPMPLSERTTVKMKLDPKHPKPLSAAQHKRLQAVADKPDVSIDYSDISAVSAEFWAKHRPTRAEPKAQVTLRIDQDVLDYFKDGGKGYQTRINDVLRSFVAAHTRG